MTTDTKNPDAGSLLRQYNNAQRNFEYYYDLYRKVSRKTIAECEKQWAIDTNDGQQFHQPMYVDQGIAMECLEMLAPFDRPGQPNTLWALVKYVTEELTKSRAAPKAKPPEQGQVEAIEGLDDSLLRFSNKEYDIYNQEIRTADITKIMLAARRYSELARKKGRK